MLARTAQGDTCRAAVGIASASCFHTCIYYARSYMGAHIFLSAAGCRWSGMRRYFAYVVGAGCTARGWVYSVRLGACKRRRLCKGRSGVLRVAAVPGCLRSGVRWR